MTVLTCDDFISSGFFKEERCCAACHEGDHCLIAEDYVLQHPTNPDIKAVLCCLAVKRVKELDIKDWDKVLDSK